MINQFKCLCKGSRFFVYNDKSTIRLTCSECGTMSLTEDPHELKEPEDPAADEQQVLDEAASVLPSFEDGFVAGGFTGGGDWYTRSGLR